MSTDASFILSEAHIARARHAATLAAGYLETVDFPLGVAMVAHAWHDGAASDVVEQLATFQNLDGGFGHGLEVDIKAPVSNPFAARLAMHILLDAGEQPVTDLAQSLQAWLVNTQDPDGDWHFSAETKAGELAPWFAGWTFPSLNPASCLAGLANQLGIATPDMLERVAGLFEEKASIDEARTGEFYNVLPYVEYAAGVDFAARDDYLAAIAANIIDTDAGGRYADAVHFWDHVLGGGPDLVRRLPVGVLTRNVDALIDEQDTGGFWPTPYDAGWQPLLTAQCCVTLARLRDGM